MEELPSPAVQRRRPDETFFRKSFRHVNNVSDPVPFFIPFPPESLFISPESLFRIYRNAPFTSPGIRKEEVAGEAERDTLSYGRYLVEQREREERQENRTAKMQRESKLPPRASAERFARHPRSEIANNASAVAQSTET